MEDNDIFGKDEKKLVQENSMCFDMRFSFDPIDLRRIAKSNLDQIGRNERLFG